MLKQLLVAMGFVLLASCAVNTPTVGSGSVSYGDTNAVETVNTDYGSTDLNMVAAEFSNKLINSGKLKFCPSYTVSKIRNKTDQYIDTETITQTIVDTLGNSPLVNSTYVLSGAEMQNQVSELSRQNDTGLYGKKVKLGKMIGAACRLDGFVSNISKDNGKIKNVFYVFNMKLFNIETGSQVWSGVKQISKNMAK